jgi:hypothetical protein
MTKTGVVPSLALAVILLSNGGAFAQSVGPDEMVRPNGAVSQKLELTPAQERAIYNAVFQRPTRTVTVTVPVAIGAPVPQAVELGDLPDQAAGDNPWAPLLKYTMVEDDVVMVDPLRMRVVGVIHQSAKP